MGFYFECRAYIWDKYAAEKLCTGCSRKSQFVKDTNVPKIPYRGLSSWLKHKKQVHCAWNNVVEITYLLYKYICYISLHKRIAYCGTSCVEMTYLRIAYIAKCLPKRNEWMRSRNLNNYTLFRSSYRPIQTMERKLNVHTPGEIESLIFQMG